MNGRKIVRLTDIPNIGPAMARDLKILGINQPEQLQGLDPLQMYDDLCMITGHRHDLCVIDVFIAAVRFMEGSSAKPWWHYTSERKALVATRL
jgi:hypothetical protein